jgi:hypothetical protein
MRLFLRRPLSRYGEEERYTMDATQIRSRKRFLHNLRRKSKMPKTIPQGLKLVFPDRPFTARLRVYPQIVAPVSKPVVLAAYKLSETAGAGLETCTTAALESGATKIRNLLISLRPCHCKT